MRKSLEPTRMLARIEMVKAMETIARAINDEEVFEYWLVNGLPDGTEPEDYEDYTDDENFADLMFEFAELMKRACSDEDNRGTFYVNGVVSEPAVIE